jgi:hypothetical protein
MKKISRAVSIGLSGSLMTGSAGMTGSVGMPGPPGFPASFFSKEVSILCIKDSGFFKQGEYYKVLLHDSASGEENPWRRITIISIDKSDNKVYKPDEFESIFLYGDKLRDKKITEILNDTV